MPDPQTARRVLAEKLQRIAVCIYIEVPESVADDIAKTCREAATVLAAVPVPAPAPEHRHTALVHALRRDAKLPRLSSLIVPLLEDAADAIEQLDAENAALRAERDDLRKHYEARLQAMRDRCPDCQASPQTPCPLHEGGERGAIDAKGWYCPNCKQRTGDSGPRWLAEVRADKAEQQITALRAEVAELKAGITPTPHPDWTIQQYALLAIAQHGDSETMDEIDDFGQSYRALRADRERLREAIDYAASLLGKGSGCQNNQCESCKFEASEAAAALRAALAEGQP